MGCQSKHVRGRLPPNEAEIVALREAILWLNRLHVIEVIIEMDAKQVYEAVLSPLHDRSEFNTLINDCKVLLSSHLFTLRHIKRCAKSVADSLAKGSLHQASFDY